MLTHLDIGDVAGSASLLTGSGAIMTPLDASEQLLVGLTRSVRVRFIDVIAGVREQFDVGLTSELEAAEARDHPVTRLSRRTIVFHRPIIRDPPGTDG